MLIKIADDKNKQIAALRKQSERPDISQQVKGRIQKEIKDIERGAKGEKEAAYEIEFNCKDSKNWAIIHDLRIECDGITAQIDHLLISRWLEVWVCETKFFSGNIVINEHGEFEVEYYNKKYGVASPIEQNKKHITALERAIKTNLIKLPKRLGFTLTPTLNSAILLSKKSIIKRPQVNIDGIDNLVKIDQFMSNIHRDIENYSGPKALGSVLKAVSSKTLKKFAEDIAALHKPAQFDITSKFK